MPESTVAVIPHLTCRNAAEAIEFYKRAFGAAVPFVMPGPDGRIMHATVDLGGGVVHVVDEYLDHGVKSPQSLGGTPVTIHLGVADCDAVYARAVEAGCDATMPLEDQFWGDRFGMVTDPYGHQWSIATPRSTMTKDEIERAMMAA